MTEETLSSDWQPSRSSVRAWVGYDLANTIFALGVVASTYLNGFGEGSPGLGVITGNRRRRLGGGILGALGRSPHRLPGNRIGALAITTGMAVCGSALLAVAPSS